MRPAPGARRAVRAAGPVQEPTPLDADFEIIIVQPGIQKSALSDGQRDLLASTQLYLSETFAVPLSVIASA